LRRATEVVPQNIPLVLADVSGTQSIRVRRVTLNQPAGAWVLILAVVGRVVDLARKNQLLQTSIRTGSGLVVSGGERSTPMGDRDRREWRRTSHRTARQRIVGVGCEESLRAIARRRRLAPTRSRCRCRLQPGAKRAVVGRRRPPLARVCDRAETKRLGWRSCAGMSDRQGSDYLTAIVPLTLF